MNGHRDSGAWKAYRGFLLLVLSLAAGIALLWGILTAATGGRFWRDFTGQHLEGPLSTVYIALLYFMALFIFIKYWNIVSGRSIKAVGIESLDLRLFGRGVALGTVALLFYFVPLVVMRAVTPVDGKAVAAEMVKAFFWGHIALNALVCLALAFTEELVFRGVIFQSFLKHVSRSHALIFTGVFFAAVHMFCSGSPALKAMYFVTLFCFNAALCSMVLLSGSLWSAVGFHFILIFVILVRNYLKVLEITPQAAGVIFGISQHPMAGLWSIFTFLVTLALLWLLYGKRGIVLRDCGPQAEEGKGTPLEAEEELA
ncbi:MAG: type II CAAX endopeptidase family protein [Candidatus Eremiobacteraeota bacterium]|nr:type II CAAX endopeptidase family protein [Candidatus Eremiobacteraeota bacterium]